MQTWHFVVLGLLYAAGIVVLIGWYDHNKKQYGLKPRHFVMALPFAPFFFLYKVLDALLGW